MFKIYRKRRDQWRQLRRQQENELQQMTSGNDHQLGIVDDNPAASECQAIIQTKVSIQDFLGILKIYKPVVSDTNMFIPSQTFCYKDQKSFIV